jgi:ribosome maturation factor RimP
MKVTEIEDIVAKAVAAVSLQLWGVEYFPQGKHAKLRVYIESEGGISADDCALASRQIGAALDVADCIGGAYTLEVSSPGLERTLFTLEQCSRYVGQKIQCKLSRAVDGHRKFSGQLKAVDDKSLTLMVSATADETVEIPWASVRKAQVTIDFD